MKKKLLILAVALLGITAVMTGCNKKQTKTAEKYSMADFVMDTVLNATIYGQEDCTLELKEELQKLENEQLSWRLNTSMAAKINEGCSKGEKVTVNEAFLDWTKECLDLAQRSQGSFDPTIGNLTRLWNIEGENPKVPDQKDIDDCLSEIGYKHINIEEKQISMDPGTSIDLGAVGKGIGCDIVNDYLNKKGNVDGAVVAIGGSVITYGQKPDGSSWKVAVQDPDSEDGVAMGVLELSGLHYISTSGDYEKYFIENGKKYHHILDPKTGYPSESGLRSVTIVCDNGLLSDGLSTACFILGEEEGMKLLEEYGAQGVFITENNEVVISQGLKNSFSILEEKYVLKK